MSPQELLPELEAALLTLLALLELDALFVELPAPPLPPSLGAPPPPVPLDDPPPPMPPPLDDSALPPPDPEDATPWRLSITTDVQAPVMHTTVAAIH